VWLSVSRLPLLLESLAHPLGPSRPVAVALAIICATPPDLRDMIAQNRFREDLYSRLNALVVRLPPLRDRTDLAVVVQKMLQRDAFAGPGRPPLSVAPAAMELFVRCTLPGYFPQLGNLPRTAAATVADAGQLRRQHLPADFLATRPPARPPPAP
ncbi:sigma 54-interacting transcriptional regulator, partial [Burkholderia cenocepacia]|uniref:sigma 54-interacting transcriptional regulator n=1 Tax=Burkholderia cenocepacia TaxID=95486 RepID=UPI00406C24FD